MRSERAGPPGAHREIGAVEGVGPVRIHRLIADADLVVLAGPVAPDRATGYAGGPISWWPAWPSTAPSERSGASLAGGRASSHTRSGCADALRRR